MHNAYTHAVFILVSISIGSFKFCSLFSILLHLDPILIQRFIHSVYGNLDKVKKLIEVSFNMRNNYPHIFLKRDPLSPGTKQVFEIT